METLSSTVEPAVQKAPLLFKALCLLTILGNVLLIVINLFKAGMLHVGSANGSVGQTAIVPLNTLLLVVMSPALGPWSAPL